MKVEDWDHLSNRKGRKGRKSGKTMNRMVYLKAEGGETFL